MSNTLKSKNTQTFPVLFFKWQERSHFTRKSLDRDVTGCVSSKHSEPPYKWDPVCVCASVSMRKWGRRSETLDNSFQPAHLVLFIFSCVFTVSSLCLNSETSDRRCPEVKCYKHKEMHTCTQLHTQKKRTDPNHQIHWGQIILTMKHVYVGVFVCVYIIICLSRFSLLLLCNTFISLFCFGT